MADQKPSDPSVTLTVESYTDSAFTLAHDVVSPDPTQDYRGTFSHLGVRMEGLESRRHLNFSVEGGPTPIFRRNEEVTNEARFIVGKPGDPKIPNRVQVTGFELNTQYFTRNNVKIVYKLTLIDALTKTSKVVAENVALAGDSIVTKVIEPVFATHAHVLMAEGGLTRFKLFGTPTADQLPQPASLLDGAKTFGCTDSSYGDPALVLRPTREGKVMAGWETCRHSARQRLILGLAKPSQVQRIEIDTYCHHMNSFKYSCVYAAFQNELSEEQLIDALPHWIVTTHGKEAVHVSDKDLQQAINDNPSSSYQLDPKSSQIWFPLLPFVPLRPDTFHAYEAEQGLLNVGEVTHLALFGIPDGGIHRLGVYGINK